jgi:hypothetical protein
MEERRPTWIWEFSPMSIRTIEAVVKIEEDRRLIVQLPADVPLGIHRVVAVLDDAPVPSAQDANGVWAFPVLANAVWPADMPLTREEIYGDDGR